MKISWFLSYLITALFILKFRTSTKILHKLQFAFTIQLQSVFFVNLNSRSVLYTAQSKSIIHSFYQVFVMIIQVCFFIYLLLTDLSQIFSFCFIQAKTVPKFWTLVSSPLPIYCSAFSRLLYLPLLSCSVDRSWCNDHVMSHPMSYIPYPSPDLSNWKRKLWSWIGIPIL